MAKLDINDPKIIKMAERLRTLRDKLGKRTKIGRQVKLAFRAKRLADQLKKLMED